jgi:Flp pilus assembly protein TadG
MSKPMRPAARHGVATVEFALLLPFLVTLLLGVWEVGRMIEVNQVLDNAAREGARVAAGGQATNDQAQQAAIDYLKCNGLPTQNVVVTVADLTSPGTDASGATQLDQLQVQVSIPFSDVRWSTLALFLSADTQLTAQATWNSLKDRAGSTAVTSPAGY